MTTEREAMTLKVVDFARKQYGWLFDSNESIRELQSVLDYADTLARAAEPAGYVTQSALDALQSCRRDEVNGTVDVWMRPNESLCATIPVFAHPPEPARDASINVRRFENAPCYLCGYNGAGYYQPASHPCARKYHAAMAQESDDGD